MNRSLVREINQYTKDLKCKWDWQAHRIHKFDTDFFKKEKKIFPYEANLIVHDMEQHWKILITTVYPEYQGQHFGEAWPVSRKAAAINISKDYLYPSTVIHEVSHGIVECCTTFHKSSIREPGHGAFWAGVYAYNLKHFINQDVTEEFSNCSIRSISEETVEKFRSYFISS